MNHAPTYDPRLVAQLASDEETRILADPAARTMVEELDLQSDDVWEILRHLDDPSWCTFYKTIQAQYVKAGVLDVYHLRFPGCAAEIYLKIGVSRIPAGSMSEVVVVYSFKKR